MLKKMMVLCATVAAFAAVAMVPLAAQGDTFYKCPHGVTNKHYCQKFKRCVVPRLEGLKVSQARRALRRHDCRLGHVRRTRHHVDGVRNGVVLSQNPSSGTIHRKGFRVNVVINRKARRSADPDHDGDHDRPGQI